jgi:hypothetical protein
LHQSLFVGLASRFCVAAWPHLSEMLRIVAVVRGLRSQTDSLEPANCPTDVQLK